MYTVIMPAHASAVSARLSGRIVHPSPRIRLQPLEGCDKDRWAVRIPATLSSKAVRLLRRPWGGLVSVLFVIVVRWLLLLFFLFFFVRGGDMLQALEELVTDAALAT